MASPATAAGAGSQGSSSQGNSFQGSMVALVTPMADGSLDYAAYRSLIDWHVQEGTDALVVVGTTGSLPPSRWKSTPS